MASVSFIPPKKVSSSEDPLLHKFFYNEIVKEEELSRSSFGPTYKACFKGDIVAIEEFIRNKWDETEENF